MKRFSGLLVFSGLMLVACGSPTVEPSHHVDAQVEGWGDAVAEGNAEAAKILSMSPGEEEQLGAGLDAAFKDPARRSEVGMTIRLSNDPTVQNYVRDIGNRLAATASRRNISYKFQVVQADEVNAYATCGGYVYVNTGLMKLVDNKAQLAAVIAHEIGHNAARHTISSMAERARLDGWSQGAGNIGGVLVRLGASAVISSPRSRTAEFEADKLGFVNLRASGLAAVGMRQFFGKLVTVYGDNPAGVFGTHPSTGARIRALQRYETPSDGFGDGLESAEYRRISSRL
jgi:predicted Zn-dependent protease